MHHKHGPDWANRWKQGIAIKTYMGSYGELAVPYTHKAGRFRRHMLVAMAVIALASNLVAYFLLQLLMGLSPCPLCVLDRIALFVLIAGVALYLLPLVAATRILGQVAVAGGLALGLGSTMRHVWLEHNPEAASCLFPSQQGGALQFLLDAFAGTSDCTQATRWLGVSLSEMTLALFLLLSCMFVVSLTRK